MDYNFITQKIVSDICQSGRISSMKGGTLKSIPEKRSLYLVDSNQKEYFLAAVSYEMRTNKNEVYIIDEFEVSKILKEIESKFTFEQLKEEYETYVSNSKNRKEESIKNLEGLKELMEQIELLTNGAIPQVIKRHPKEYFYYVDLKFNDGDLVRISCLSVDNDQFHTITFNLHMEIIEIIELSKTQLTFLLRDKINKHFDLRKTGKMVHDDQMFEKNLRDARNYRIKLLAQYLLDEKFGVILKVSNGYQCILNKKIFEVGDNKSNNEFEMTNLVKIEEYLKRLNIKSYYVIKAEDNVKSMTSEELANLKYLFL
ncbi:MAG: hypothetical protein R3Y64_06745 [Peptostreptococcaceae bacterium]